MTLRRIASDALPRAYVCWFVSGWFVLLGAPSLFAQFGEFGNSPPAAAPATVETASSNTQRRLSQIETLLTSEEWEEAIDVLSELISQPTTELVTLPGDTIVPLRTYCQMRLAQLPPEALANYRRRVDDLAADWLERGIQNREAELLQRVVDELYCSNSGDAALLALGELALERGDIGAARGYWEAIAPGLRGPDGQPLVDLTQDVDLATHAETVRDYLKNATQPTGCLAYPDSDLPVADVLAKLVVASIRDRDLARAERELNLVELLDPSTKGRLAGKEIELVPALREMLASARTWPATPARRDWPTFAGDASRSGAAFPIGHALGVVWEVPLTPRPTFAPRQSFQIINGRMLPSFAPPDSEISSPVCQPLMYDGNVLFRDAEQIRAVSLATGKPSITRNGVLLEESQSNNERPDLLTRELQIFGQQVATNRHFPRPRLMTVCGNTLFAIGAPPDEWNDANRAATRPRDRILGLDLRRDGLLAVQLDPPEAGWSFSGPPICADGRMFVPMCRDEIQPQLYVGCYSAATGRLLWRTTVCSSQSLNEFRQQPPCDLLTLGADAVFFNTNVGIVAAVEQRDGRIRWLRRYPRNTVNDDNNWAIEIERRETPCVYHRGTVVVAPADTTSVFALDPNTGATLWNTERAYDVEHLLGAVERTVVASGRRLWLLDTATGAVRVSWPDSVAAGIRGVGRGCIAGREVFWPTENAIYAFDATTGRQSRQPIDLIPLGLAGANLVAADGMLLLAGQEKIVALGASSSPPAAEPQLSQRPNFHFLTRE